MSRERRRALRRAAPLVALTAAVLVAALLGGRRVDGPPLDPAATGRDGTKALVDVLTELGVEVRITDAVAPEDAVALLLDDNLGEDAAADLRAWLRAGGTLVVADPLSRFAPQVVGPTSIGPLETTLSRGCELAALADVRRVAAPDGVVYDTENAEEEGAVGCFPRAEGSWLLAWGEGTGTLVAIGGPGALTNGALGKADNGLLAAALLAPGTGSLAFLRPGAPGEGEATLADLIAEPVRLALLQLAVAFCVVVLWRARRLGAPVVEPRPVQVAGSELVTAVGNLLQQTRARGQAARLLRDGLRRDLAERLGLPADSPAAVVAAAAARRSGRSPDDLAALLTGGEPAGEAALVALAVDLERERRAALGSPLSTKEPTRVE